MKENIPEPEVDWFIFWGGTLILLAVVIPIVFIPDLSKQVIQSVFTWITTELGVLYVVTATLTIGFLLVVAVSDWGRIVLGEPDEAYSMFSWISMLFCCGIGAGLIYWGAAEWTYYYVAPPFGVEPRSDEAVIWASSYGMFHWGPVGWALYTLPAVALCCSYHLKKVPSLRLSDACEPVLGKLSQGAVGRVIDLFFIIGLLATAATGIGLGTSVVTSSITRATGLEDGFPHAVRDHHGHLFAHRVFGLSGAE